MSDQEYSRFQRAMGSPTFCEDCEKRIPSCHETYPNPDGAGVLCATCRDAAEMVGAMLSEMRSPTFCESDRD